MTFAKKNSIVSSLAFFTSPLFVFAAPIFTRASDICNKIEALSNVLYSIGVALGVIAVLYAAYKYYSSAGDPKGVGEGHEALKWAIIGIAVVIIAGGVPTIVASILGGTVGGGCS